MAITFPLTLPEAPAPRSVTPVAKAVTALGASPFTGSQQVQEFPGQWWEFRADLPPMTRDEAEAWVALKLKLNGKAGTFLMGDPAAKLPRGIATGAPLVNGGGQSGNSLNTRGWSASKTGILKTGDWLQIGAGLTARLYKVLDDADSDASGIASLTIWPKLRQPAPADGAEIIVNSPVGLFRMADNVMSWDVGEARIYGLSFAAVEAL